MNAVIYTNDFEPITVIDLPIEIINQMKKERFFRWRVPVMEPVRTTPHDGTEPIRPHLRIVCLHAEHVLRRCGNQAMVIMTNDEESALLLTSSCLPGQVTTFKDEFQKGFISAIFKVLGAC